MARKTTDYDRWNKMNFDDSSDEEKQHPNIDKEFMRRILREKRAKEIAEQEAEMKKLEEEGTPEALQKLQKMKERMVVTKDSVRVVDDRTIVKAGEEAPELPKPGTGGILTSTGNEAEEDLEKAEHEYVEFKAKHENVMKKYAHMVVSESEEYILENPVILQESAIQFLLLYVLELQMENKGSKAKNAARQYLMLKNIIDLAAQSHQDPRAAVKPFFSKITLPENKARLTEEATAFAARVAERAEQKKKEQAEEQTVELSREERLGPGGLDPVEVLESLPQGLQDAFIKQDKELLIKELQSLPKEEAEDIIEKCTKSGLWNPEGGASS